jgi:glutamate racemase
MWVPLVENNEAHMPGADYFVKQRVDQMLTIDPLIDSIILGCTHYPLLMDKIQQYLPTGIKVIPQGDYVATSLQDYLQRHSNMEFRISQSGTLRLLTTEQPEQFNESATIFLDHPVDAVRITL